MASAKTSKHPDDLPSADQSGVRPLVREEVEYVDPDAGPPTWIHQEAPQLPQLYLVPPEERVDLGKVIEYVSSHPPPPPEMPEEVTIPFALLPSIGPGPTVPPARRWGAAAGAVTGAVVAALAVTLAFVLVEGPVHAPLTAFDTVPTATAPAPVALEAAFAAPPASEVPPAVTVQAPTVDPAEKPAVVEKLDEPALAGAALEVPPPAETPVAEPPPAAAATAERGVPDEVEEPAEERHHRRRPALAEAAAPVLEESAPAPWPMAALGPRPELAPREAPTPAEDVTADAPESLAEAPSPAEIERAMAAVTEELRECAGGQFGLVRLRMTFAPSGRATNAVVSGIFAGTPEGSCMARAARHALVPRFAGPRFDVSYPLRL